MENFLRDIQSIFDHKPVDRLLKDILRLTIFARIIKPTIYETDFE